jgi:translation initiation factor 3 subunit B
LPAHWSLHAHVTGLRGFEWSPKGNIIAYWAPEKLQQPARVVLVELPSKSEVRRKPLFNVENCELHWQDGGDYLCVKVGRLSPSWSATWGVSALTSVAPPPC